MIMIAITLGLSACGLFEDKTNNEKETPVVTEDKDNNPVVIGEDDEKNPVEIEEDDEKNPDTTKDQDHDPPNNVEDKHYENETFKEVVITVNEKIIVTGKAQVFEGVFQYAIVAEGEILTEGHYQTDGAPAWGNFELTFEKELAEKEGATLELFFFSPKDGAKTNVLEIPLINN